MSADLEALARELAESGRVPWVRGMVEESGAICQRALAGLPLLWCVDDSVVSADGCEPALLDLTNDGNRGHLLARARVLWGGPELHPQYADGDACDGDACDGDDDEGRELEEGAAGEWCMFVGRDMPLIWRYRDSTIKATGATDIEAIAWSILAAPGHGRSINNPEGETL